MSILIGVAVLGLCVIALAWLDAGREERRLIVAPVISPEMGR
jgi:hypothetical protein